MQLTFKKLTFSNFLGFGADTTEVDFSDRLNLITGTNGRGKSTILEALTFCLYGKPYRKIKIDSLINWYNLGNLKTTCEFTVNGIDEYVVTRNLSPDLLIISKNGKELDLLSHKKLTQEELDKIIGVSYTVFKTTIALAISYNEPFLSLDAKGKRSLVEQSFGISIFGKMLEVVKKKTSETKKRKEMAEFSVEQVEGTIESLKEQLLDLVKANQDFEEDKKKRIAEIEESLESVRKDNGIQAKEQTALGMKIAKATKILSKVDKKSLQLKEKTLEKKISELEYEKKQRDKTAEYYRTNTSCPSCHAEISDNKKLEEQARYKVYCDNYKFDIEKYSATLKVVSSDIDKVETYESDKSKGERELLATQRAIEQNIKQIDFYNKELTKVQEHKNEINLKNFEKTIADKILELDKKKMECSLWNKDAVTLKTASAILSEDGVRTYVIDKILPLLNKKINEYLDIFELPVKITFNKQMEETIVNLRNFKKEISYYSCSEGEKKRIDFAMLLSFIETMKIVSNWNCNLLMIDELLDSSIDEVGLEKMIGTLKKISEEKEMGIYVISHRINSELSSYFSNIVRIKKDENDFSSIEKSAI